MIYSDADIEPTCVVALISDFQVVLLRVMNHFSIFVMSMYVCTDTSMYVGVASFPGTLAPECEHGNHAGEDNIFSHVSDVRGRKE